jgi:transposase
MSKRYFHACLLQQIDSKPVSARFDAHEEGFVKFITWVKRVSSSQMLHFCLEETGIYGRGLAAFLHEAGHHVSLVNAALIKHHGRSLNLRMKTDTVDAWLIAHYTLQRVPARWQPPKAAHAQIRALARRRQQLIELIIIEKNHAEAAQEDCMRQSIQQIIALLSEERDKISEDMGALMQSDPVLNTQRQLLRSIPHIGDITAHHLLAELPPVDAFASARKLCAFAGVTPRRETSGDTIHKRSRLCKQGRPGLRRLLFTPALAILHSHHSPLKPFAQRLLQAGKAPKCVVGALMRKLLSLVFAILRSGKPFDAHYQRHIAAAHPKP